MNPTVNDLTTCRRPRRSFRTVVLLLGAAALALGPAAAVLAQDEDPNLDQTIGSEQEIVTGEQAVLDIGHVDIGPRFVDGAWTVLIHDDAAKADPDTPSVWRYPEDAVFAVGDAAILAVPDDETYAFIGADPGAEVYVVPQTQHPDVVWVGWNTQDPEVMETIDRGVTMSLTAVEGPGSLVVYLQSGSFEAPNVLWDSKIPEVQSAWVDVNTHAHANWVFTEPGVYLVEMEVAADLIDGTTVSDTRALRFAVGDATAAEDAFSATSALPADTSTGDDDPAVEPASGTTASTSDDGAGGDPAAGDGSGENESDDGSDGVMTTIIVVVALALALGLVTVSVRSRSAKRRGMVGKNDGRP